MYRLDQVYRDDTPVSEQEYEHPNNACVLTYTGLMDQRPDLITARPYTDETFMCLEVDGRELKLREISRTNQVVMERSLTLLVNSLTIPEWQASLRHKGATLMVDLVVAHQGYVWLRIFTLIYRYQIDTGEVSQVTTLEVADQLSLSPDQATPPVSGPRSILDMACDSMIRDIPLDQGRLTAMHLAITGDGEIDDYATPLAYRPDWGFVYLHVHDVNKLTVRDDGEEWVQLKLLTMPLTRSGRSQPSRLLCHLGQVKGFEVVTACLISDALTVVSSADEGYYYHRYRLIWRPQLHHHFPLATRRAIQQLYLMQRRAGAMPVMRDLLPTLAALVAS